MQHPDELNNVLKYIEEHIEEPLSIKQLSDIAGYSEYHFMRKFKGCMNKTLSEYINRRKLIVLSLRCSALLTQSEANT